MRHIRTFNEGKTEEESWNQIYDSIWEIMDDFGIKEEPEEEVIDGFGHYIDDVDYPFFEMSYNADGSIRGINITNLQSKPKAQEILKRLKEIKHTCEIRSKLKLEIWYSISDESIFIRKKR